MISHDQGGEKAADTTNEESLSLVVKAVLAIALLEKMGISSSSATATAVEAMEDKLGLGALMMQLFQVIQFNTHPVDQVLSLIHI